MIFSQRAFFLFTAVVCTPAAFGEHGFVPPAHYPAECRPQEATRIALLTTKLRKEGKLPNDEVEEIQKLIRKVPSACLSKDLLADAESAMKNFALLPCLVAEDRQKELTVVLSGEQHDKSPKEKIRRLREDADAGKLIAIFESNAHHLGLEGRSYYPAYTQKNVVVDADGRVPRAVLHLFEKDFLADPLNMLVSEKYRFDFQELIPWLVRQEKDKGYLELYQQMLKVTDSFKRLDVAASAFYEPYGEKKPSFSDETRNRYNELFSSMRDEKKKLLELAEKIPAFTAAALKRRLSGQLMLLLNDPDFIFRYVPPQFSDQLKNGEGPFLHEEIEVNWRDREMAWMIALQLCRASEKKINRVHLHAGRAHIPGVYVALKQLLNRSGAKVDVGVDVNSMTKKPENDFDRKLEEWLKQLPQSDRK